MIKPESHSIDELKKAYSEGFCKGSAGMSNVYLPLEYYKSEKLKSAWLKGWGIGHKNSGDSSLKLPGKKYIYMVLFILGVSFFVYLILNRIEPEAIQPIKPVEWLEKSSATTSIASTIVVSLSSTVQDKIIESEENFEVANAILQGETLVEPEKEKLQTIEPPKVALVETSTTKIEVPILNTDVINRSIFAENIVNREPLNQLADTTDFLPTIYYFSEVINFIGNNITHRWYFNDKFISEITFEEVKGLRWRLYSYKNVENNQYGKWTVKVYDQLDRLLTKKSILISQESSQ